MIIPIALKPFLTILLASTLTLAARQTPNQAAISKLWNTYNELDCNLLLFQSYPKTSFKEIKAIILAEPSIPRHLSRQEKECHKIIKNMEKELGGLEVEEVLGDKRTVLHRVDDVCGLYADKGQQKVIIGLIGIIIASALRESGAPTDVHVGALFMTFIFVVMW